MAMHFHFGGHTYEIINTARTWAQAAAHAESLGARLAMVGSEAENTALFSNAMQSVSLTQAPRANDGGGAVYLWLGASDLAQEGSWLWLDGSAVQAYANWGSGVYGTEPDNFQGNQDALGLGLQAWPQPSGGIGVAGRWNDVDAGNALWSLVEWDYLRGTGGADTLTGGAGHDRLDGLAGNDYLDGGLGGDTMTGGAGNDIYVVNASTDIVRELAGGGNDSIRASISYSLADTDGAGGMGGQVENLQLLGGAAINATGNALANVIGGNAAANTLNGGAGVDTVTYAWASAAVRVSLALTTAQDTRGAGRDRLLNFENLTGSNFADTLIGNAGANILAGGLGNDTLSGGNGADGFLFNTRPAASGNQDAITDFVTGTDKIRLEDAVFSGIGALGNFAAADARFHVGSAAHDASDRIVYCQQTGVLYFDADGTGAAAALPIATLGTGVHPALAATDILVQ